MSIFKSIKLTCFLLLPFISFSDSLFFKPINYSLPRIENRKINILPLGNSITASSSLSPSYRYFLWKKFHQAGYSNFIDFVGTKKGVGENEDPMFLDFDQDHAGYMGFRTSDFEDGIGNIFRFVNSQSGNNSWPDIVLFHLGTNDQVHNFHVDSSKLYISNLIDSMRICNPRIIIVLAKIVPALSSQTILNMRIINFNKMISDLFTKMNSSISPIFLVDMHTGYNLNNFFDNVHPNDGGGIKLHG